MRPNPSQPAHGARRKALMTRWHLFGIFGTMITLAAGCSSSDDERDDDDPSSGEPSSSSGASESSSGAGGSSSSSSSGGSSGTSSSSGGGSSSSSGAAACTSDLSAWSERYDVECLASQCCDQAAACALDLACQSFDRCVAPCSSKPTAQESSACVRACRDDAGGTVPSAYPAFGECKTTAPLGCSK